MKEKLYLGADAIYRYGDPELDPTRECKCAFSAFTGSRMIICSLCEIDLKRVAESRLAESSTVLAKTVLALIDAVEALQRK